MGLPDAFDTPYDDRPAVAVLTRGADPAPALAAVVAGGARVVGPAELEPGAGWGGLAIAPVIWLELGGSPDGDAAALLDRLRDGAEWDGWQAVVCAPQDHLDLVAARALHGNVHLVLGGSGDERAVALGLALAGVADRRLARVQEGGGSEVERLRRLTEEVGRIAQSLAGMSATAGARTGEGGGRVAARGEATRRSSAAVRATVRARRLRDQFFQPELFADPAWDMLLDLYAAHLDQHRVAVSSLCIASAVPATTALRWIKTLTDAGLFIRRADPTDGRRVFIELSPEAAAAMDAYFGELERQADAAAWTGPLTV